MRPLLIALLLAAPSAAGPQAYLQGVPAFGIEILDLGARARAFGLSEKRLGKILIRKLKKRRLYRKGGNPRITLTVSIAKDSVGGFIAFVSLELLQEVRLVRDPSVRINGASTWRQSRMISGRRDDVEALIIRTAENFLDDLLTEYAEANPK